MSQQIAVATIRNVLKNERKKLRERRQKDFDQNRARSSYATENAIARVLVLEELLDGSITGKSGEPTPAPDDSLDL